MRRERWIIRRRRPAARFILIGLYSARREETIRQDAVGGDDNSSMDEPGRDGLSRARHRGGAHQKTAAAGEDRHAAPPPSLRWRALDLKRSAELRKAGVMEDDDELRFIVHRMQDGQPLAGKIRSAWEGILEDAGLDEDVVRHTLRHTAVTWLMQQGTDLWEAAGWLGMTVEQLEENYGHHHPDFQNQAGQEEALIAHRPMIGAGA